MNLELIGIDYGSKRFGLAFGDLESGLVISHDQVVQSSDVLSVLSEQVDFRKAKAIIVGYPVNFKTNKTRVTQEVDDFIETLKKQFPDVKVQTINERGSTQRADIKNDMKDNLSAAVILREWLDLQS